MNRRKWLTKVVVAMGCGLCLFGPSVPAEEPRDPITKMTLKETLSAGLRTTRPQDLRYLQRVSQLVQNGVLPEKLVMATFNWARKKNDKRFQYFQAALEAQATKLGILI